MRLLFLVLFTGMISLPRIDFYKFKYSRYGHYWFSGEYQSRISEGCLRHITDTNHDPPSWRHHMKTFPCFWPSQRPLAWRFDAFFNLRLNRRLSKQSRYRGSKTTSRLLWRHCNVHSHWTHKNLHHPHCLISLITPFYHYKPGCTLHMIYTIVVKNHKRFTLTAQRRFSKMLCNGSCRPHILYKPRTINNQIHRNWKQSLQPSYISQVILIYETILCDDTNHSFVYSLRAHVVSYVAFWSYT